jgi:sortase A
VRHKGRYVLAPFVLFLGMAGYAPQNVKRADAFRKIAVKVTAPGYSKVRVRTREGYFLAASGHLAGSGARIRIICRVLFVLGSLALGYVGLGFADSHLYQAIEIRKFERAMGSAKPQIFAEGDVLGEIQIPRLEMDSIVVQGDSNADLGRAVGHLSASALPGEQGNIVLAGHRDTFFRPLRNIRQGDEIVFKTENSSFEYRVESTEVVAPSDVQVIAISTGHDLTLVTCFPFYFVGPAPKRFIVRATEVQGPSQ